MNPVVPAALWYPVEDQPGSVACKLCPHRCRIGEGAAGLCRVRLNRRGRLFSASSAHIASACPDPVEKKPLYHFLPGTGIFSIGCPGCNMRCSFCQNHGLSQVGNRFGGGTLPAAGPDELAKKAVDAALRSGCSSMAYTYSEPTVFFELVESAAKLAASAGLANVLVSNGYMTRACLDELSGLIQAANFDLKSFSDEFYRRYCGASLEPVLQTLKGAISHGWWLEITTLLIPDVNDSEAELRAIAFFIANELGPHVPWHVSRFRPMYRLTNVPATPAASVARALEAGKQAGLHFVYAGNMPGHPTENTMCPQCGHIVIGRNGYRLLTGSDGNCANCGLSLPGIWQL